MDKVIGKFPITLGKYSDEELEAAAVDLERQWRDYVEQRERAIIDELRDAEADLQRIKTLRALGICTDVDVICAASVYNAALRKFQALPPRF